MNLSFELAPIFTDDMVLQRDAEIPIWGKAADGVHIKLEFCGQVRTAEAAGGKWRVTLSPVKAGGPFEMKIASDNDITVLKNILVGDVWIAGGQSNMEYTLVNTKHGHNEIPAADYPGIRCFQVPRIPYTNALVEDPDTYSDKSAWEICTPQTAGNFSAVAFHFAKDLYRATGIPIGIINCNWGGTSASCWMNEKYLCDDPEVKSYLDEYKELVEKQDNESYENEVRKYDQEVEAYNTRAAQVPFNPDNVDQFFSDQGVGPFPWPPPMGPKCHLRPCGLYYTMLEKIIPYAIKGVIWYQGESDAHKPSLYRRLFGKMIENWRHDWNNPKLPFLFVQLTAFGEPEADDWAILREQQLISAREITDTGMVVIIDCGDRYNIHPTDKRPVGERLARLAENRVYGLAVEYSGPVYREMKIEADKAVLYFDYTGTGLFAKGESLKGFKICGEDKKFVDAKAEIKGDTVVVQIGEVSRPTAVRYGWGNYVEVNLYNMDGLPASPFRTDN